MGILRKTQPAQVKLIAERIYASVHACSAA